MDADAGIDKAATTCPLCGRVLVAGPSVDVHHLVPASRGGRETVRLHRICHQMIHATFSEKALADHYHSVGRLREHETIRRFILWVRKKHPEYYDRSRFGRARRRRAGVRNK